MLTQVRKKTYGNIIINGLLAKNGQTTKILLINLSTKLVLPLSLLQMEWVDTVLEILPVRCHVTDLGRDWINTDFRELSQIRDWMIAAIDAENRKIYELGQNEEYKGMGTTIEVLAFVDNAVIFAHVGDSRIALIRNGEYKQLTNDHSLVQCSYQGWSVDRRRSSGSPTT